MCQVLVWHIGDKSSEEEIFLHLMERTLWEGSGWREGMSVSVRRSGRWTGSIQKRGKNWCHQLKWGYSGKSFDCVPWNLPFIGHSRLYVFDLFTRNVLYLLGLKNLALFWGQRFSKHLLTLWNQESSGSWMMNTFSVNSVGTSRPILPKPAATSHMWQSGLWNVVRLNWHVF